MIDPQVLAAIKQTAQPMAPLGGLISIDAQTALALVAEIEQLTAERDMHRSSNAAHWDHAVTLACDERMTEQKHEIRRLTEELRLLHSPERVRHKKRGTFYYVLGPGTLQTAKPLEDNAPLVIYHSDPGGRLRARAEAEFYDGRFEKAPAPALVTPSEHAQAVEREVVSLLTDAYAKGVADERERTHKFWAVCFEIIEIVDERDRQEKANMYGGTPGGLEHMGDVWRLLSKWADIIRSGK